MMKKLDKKKMILIGIITAVVVIGAVICFLLFSKGDTDIPTSKDTLEIYENKNKEWKFTALDLTEELSGAELKNIQEECQIVIDSYNGVMFSFMPDTPDYTAELLAFCVGPEVSGSNRRENEQQYSVFRGMGVESAYTKFTPYSLTVNDGTEVPTVVINGLLSINYKSNNISQGDYDVCTKYILQKRNDVWSVYSSQFSTIYQSGSVKAFSSDNNNTITYSGTRVGSFE